MKERVLKITVSPRKHKKYRAFVSNPKTKVKRVIDFGDNRYEQYTDSTPIKKYKTKNHYNKKRRDNYFTRHSGTKHKAVALKKERKKSKGKLNAKILSHKYLW